MKDEIKCLLKYGKQIMGYRSETNEFKEVCEHCMFNLYVNQST